jgi:hypothetical protein
VPKLGFCLQIGELSDARTESWHPTGRLWQEAAVASRQRA